MLLIAGSGRKDETKYHFFRFFGTLGDCGLIADVL